MEKVNYTKKKKPKFVRQESHKKPKLGTKWRKPRGIDSKQRLRLRGHTKTVKNGYRNPKSIRGKLRSGMMPILVKSIDQIKNIDKEKEIVIISSNIGKRKKLELIKKCQEHSLKIFGIDDSEKYCTDVKQKFDERRAAKKKAKEEKENKKKETEKKKDKKEGLSKKLEEKKPEKKLAENTEDEKLKEKKEKDKLLIKKEN